jgi:hypothetical protein
MTAVLALSFVSHASAASFNQNNIMGNVVFDNVNSMSAASIDGWLNSNFPSSCISTKNGFFSPDPVGYNPSQGFLYGGNVSAGQVVYDAAQAYGINPQVLLATLQKESSVVSGTASYHCQYINTAMGYGCPDSGSCPTNPATMSGFSKQVIHAAWLFKFGEQRSQGNTGWAVIKGGWDNSDDPPNPYGGPMTQGNLSRGAGSPVTFYDGYTTIDGTAVHMDDGPTAALYWYTPHFSGNQNFFNIFVGWFGSTQTTTPFAWGYEGQWAYSDAGRSQLLTDTPTTTPGGTIYLRVKARNLGNQTWSQSFMHLGDSRPMDRVSQFYDSSSWLSNTRPAQMIESSVAPGDVGTFDFTMKAPNAAGSYNEYFNLVAEGHTWLNDLGLFFTVNVNGSIGTSNSTNTSLTSGQSISTNDYLLSPDSQSTLAVQRDGNLVLFSNFKPVWATGAVGNAANHLTMQGDGNLVLYNSSNVALWSAQTNGNPGARLVLQTDGNMVIYSASNAPLWATYTLHNPDHLAYVNTTLKPGGIMYPGQSLDTTDRRFHLILQRDGNLVLYSPNRATWAAGTDGKQAAFLIMQGDGNLVLYDRSYRPIWYSRTTGGGQLHLVLQQDGNLVLYNTLGTPYWHTVTSGVE